MNRRISFIAVAGLAAMLGLSACNSSDDNMDRSKSTKMMSTEGKMDEKKMDIVDTAMGPGMPYNTLCAALKSAGLVETLKGEGPFTVFAPTDDAFKKLPAGTLDDLMKPENKAKLQSILKFHVVAGNHPAKEVTSMTEAKTVEGSPLMIKEVDGKWMIGNDKAWATIIKTDVKATNGTIHWIDTVLMP